MSYDRTTYTFSPNALAAVGRGLESFLLADGHIRLICNYKLDMPVYQAIKDGLAQASDVLLEAVPPKSLIESSDLLVQGTEACVRPADMACGSGTHRDKGRFRTGRTSASFTKKKVSSPTRGATDWRSQAPPTKHSAAWSYNYESTLVFTDWKEPDRVDEAQQGFDYLWEGKSKFAIVTPISETHINALKQIAPTQPPVLPPERTRPSALDIRERIPSSRLRYFGRNYTGFSLAASAGVLPEARARR